MTTTPTGVETETTSNEDVENAFLANWADAGLLSESDEGANRNDEGDETTPTGADNESEGRDEDDLDFGDEDEGDDTAEEASDQDTVEATDEAVVKLTVDGEEKKVTVKELKRLYGQEASLTRKSQEIAEARKKAEDEGAKFIAQSERLLQKAQARYQPYAQIDWMLAQKTLSTAEFAALRKEALTAYEDVKFLSEETEAILDEQKGLRQAEMVEAAKESLAVLQEKVPNWSKEHYDEIRSFAVSKGLTVETVNSIIDPVAIMLIRDAMLYQKARDRAESKRKAVPSPRKVVRSSKGAGVPNIGRKAQADAALARLKSTGSASDAEAAFMARWSTEDA